MRYNRTLVYLRELIDRALQRGESRLPTIAVMAEGARVSSVSVWKAVRTLRREGVLVGRRGGCIELASLAEPGRGESGRMPQTKWERAAVRLRDEIAQGIHHPGEALPRSKELCQRFGIAYPALRKVLLSLAQESLLEPRARGYAVSRLCGGRTAGSIVLIASADAGRSLSTFTFRTIDYYRTLESECSQNNLELVTVPVDFAQCRNLRECAAWRALGTRAVKPAKRIRGCILVTTGMDGESIDRYMADLAAYGAPCALLDENGEIRLPRQSRQREMRLFSIASSPASGMAVARHLHAMGHRHVAYLSPLHATQWSRARLIGLTKTCGELGGRVYPFVRADVGNVDTDDGVFPQSDAPWLLGGARLSMHERLSAGQAAQDVQRRTRKLAALMEPLMRSALAVAPLSAWVCATDYFGLMALDYLESAGRHVPGDLAMAAFDDTYAAFSHGLTSYNFNGPAYIRAMLRYILNPSSKAGAGRFHMPVEIEGFITPRSSTTERMLKKT